MRRILEHDVKAAAVALARIPKDEQPRIFKLWLDQADWAHKIHKRTGKPHPIWGNGSLYQAMHFHPQDGFDYSNEAHCSAMEYVLHALLERREILRSLHSQDLEKSRGFNISTRRFTMCPS